MRAYGKRGTGVCRARFVTEKKADILAPRACLSGGRVYLAEFDKLLVTLATTFRNKCTLVLHVL